MVERVKLGYFNEGLQIGFVSINEAYLLLHVSALLSVEVYRGKLVYRVKGSSRRISYQRLKSGLRKTSRLLEREVPNRLHETSPKKKNPRQTHA